MNLPSSPGFWKRLAQWFWNFILMPGRIAELHAARSREDSVQRDCPNCEKRMTVSNTTARDGVVRWAYECKSCEQSFWYKMD